MGLVLLNLQSNQQIRLEYDNPLVIGRTNVVGCSDKRVSRSHGRISCTNDGKIHIVALHTNPCFYTRNGLPPILQLNKDEEETLTEGDCLGLLPNAFWFKIMSDTESQNKKRTNPVIKSESDDSVSNNLVVKKELDHHDPSVEDSCSSSSKTKNENPSNSTEISNPSRSPGLEKTRRLPLWMYEIDDPSEKKSPLKRTLYGNNESKNKKVKASSDSNSKPPDIPFIKIEDDVSTPSTSKVLDSSMEYAESSKKISETSVASSSNQKTEKEGYESDVPSDSPKKLIKRPLCQYESNCYRKNPQHKLDFCHPGDEDYVPYENRPLCQYGSGCYRTSKIHKVEYRHPPQTSNPTSPSSVSSVGEERPPCIYGRRCYNKNPHHASSPLPAKRRRKTIKKQELDLEDEEEDYDVEDPFINDASSDEYVPSEGNSEEELDTSFQDD